MKSETTDIVNRHIAYASTAVKNAYGQETFKDLTSRLDRHRFSPTTLPTDEETWNGVENDLVQAVNLLQHDPTGSSACSASSLHCVERLRNVARLEQMWSKLSAVPPHADELTRAYVESAVESPRVTDLFSAIRPRSLQDHGMEVASLVSNMLSFQNNYVQREVTAMQADHVHADTVLNSAGLKCTGTRLAPFLLQSNKVTGVVESILKALSDLPTDELTEDMAMVKSVMERLSRESCRGHLPHLGRDPELASDFLRANASSNPFRSIENLNLVIRGLEEVSYASLRARVIGNLPGAAELLSDRENGICLLYELDNEFAAEGAHLGTISTSEAIQGLEYLLDEAKTQSSITGLRDVEDIGQLYIAKLSDALELARKVVDNASDSLQPLLEGSELADD